MAGGPDLRTMVAKAKEMESCTVEVDQWIQARVGELEEQHGAPLPAQLERPFDVLNAQMAVVIVCMSLVQEVLESRTLTAEQCWTMTETVRSAAESSAVVLQPDERFVDLETGRPYTAKALRQLLADDQSI